MTRNPAWLIAILLATTGLLIGRPLAAQARADSPAVLLDEARALMELQPATARSEDRLRQIVFAIGERQASTDARALLLELGRREPAVLVRHEEGPALVPYADVGAAARFVLRAWRREAARRQAVAALHDGDGGFVERFLSAADPERAGMLDAVTSAGAGALALQRNALAERLADPAAGRLAAALGLALADRELLDGVIDHGAPRDALDLLPKLQKSLGPAAALDVLERALARPEVASAAVFEIARLRGTLPGADRVLWELLADPQLGGSAAAVLARGADRHTRRRLTDIVASGDDALLVERARLALRLSVPATAPGTAGEAR